MRFIIFFTLLWRTLQQFQEEYSGKRLINLQRELRKFSMCKAGKICKYVMELAKVQQMFRWELLLPYENQLDLWWGSFNDCRSILVASSIQYLIVYLLKENDFHVSGGVHLVLIYTIKPSKFTVGSGDKTQRKCGLQILIYIKQEPVQS